MEQWGCFWWVFVSCIIRRCPLFCCTLSFVLHLFGTTQYTCTISVFYISSTPFEPIPAQPMTRGIGDTLAFLSTSSTWKYSLVRALPGEPIFTRGRVNDFWFRSYAGTRGTPAERRHCRGGSRRSNSHRMIHDSQHHRGRGHGRG